MRKLVLITQVVDPDDPNLGATCAKIAALARTVDEVAVICDRGRDGVLPENCRVRRFGSSSRARRAARFAAAIAAEMRDRPVGVLAHMIPLYAVVAAPFVRPRRVPLMLWYTHWKAHNVLRLATFLCTDVLSVDARSFPLRTSKLRAIGHGIDLGEFPCRPPAPAAAELRIVSLGRYSRAKRLDELVEGVRIARERGVAARIDLFGTTGGPALEEYKRELEELVGRDGYRAFASVGGPVPRTDVPSVYERADVVASAFNSPDKIVFEAAASCRPVLAADVSFDALLAGIEPPLAFERGRPETLADRIEALARLGADERGAIGKELRERVRTQHSVETWAERIVALT